MSDKVTIQQEIGLGDMVEKVTRKTRVKKVVKKVFDALGKDCGCDKRQEALNKVGTIKRKRTVNCLTKDEHDMLKRILEDKQSKRTDSINIIKTWERVFSKKTTAGPGCPKCVTTCLSDRDWETL